jgi:large subunit ribosomal protein L25
MKEITLEVSQRDASLSRGSLNKMREAGNLPGVVYGAKIGTIPVIVTKKELINVINTYGLNAIITLRIKGQPVQAMIKEIQNHPVTGSYWHVDFNEISMNKKIRAEIQVQFSGEADGLKEGGIIQYGDTTVEVECLPQNLPEKFTLDISGLKIGDKLTVADLEQTDDVKITADPAQILISVIPPAMEKEDGEEKEEADPQAKAPEDKAEGGNKEE